MNNTIWNGYGRKVLYLMPPTSNTLSAEALINKNSRKKDMQMLFTLCYFKKTINIYATHK